MLSLPMEPAGEWARALGAEYQSAGWVVVRGKGLQKTGWDHVALVMPDRSVRLTYDPNLVAALTADRQFFGDVRVGETIALQFTDQLWTFKVEAQTLPEQDPVLVPIAA